MNSEIPLNPNPEQTDESTVAIPMDAIAESITDVEFSEMLDIPAQEKSPVPLELSFTDLPTQEAAIAPIEPENEAENKLKT